MSKLILGTDYFGTTLPKEAAFELMDRYAAAGGNCIDTARAYAQWVQDGKGASERVIGEWLRSRNIRSRILISTKGGHPPFGRMDQGRLSRQCIENDLNESLEALGVDYVDIYWLHRDDINSSVEDIMESIHAAASNGKVRAIGCSNWKAERIHKANAYAIKNGLMPFVASQIQWSLASTTPEAHQDPTIVCMDDNEYEWYINHNMPVVAYSSQAKGFFTVGALKGVDSINQKARTRFYTPENIARLERVKQYAHQSGFTPTAVALGYILCNRLPAMAIVGCKNLEQLEDTLTAQDVDLPASVAEWLF